MAGVQQPGMTGQVKEDIISRFNELGVEVVDGKIRIDKSMISFDEFKSESEKPSLQFTFCGIPFTYIVDNADSAVVKFTSQEFIKFNDLEINRSVSKLIFERSNKIQSIHVFLNKNEI